MHDPQKLDAIATTRRLTNPSGKGWSSALTKDIHPFQPFTNKSRSSIRKRYFTIDRRSVGQLGQDTENSHCVHNLPKLLKLKYTELKKGMKLEWLIMPLHFGKSNIH